ncbi:hypothetical protein GQ457_07G039430 [Hibiscus cannabinus]
MQDGRKTRKQNKDQKLTNELHKINKILARKKMEKESGGEGGDHSDDIQPGKKVRISDTTRKNSLSCFFLFLSLRVEVFRLPNKDSGRISIHHTIKAAKSGVNF